MLKRELQIFEREDVEPILQACTTCRIAMIAEGKPYILPMVFGYEWDENGMVLYMHCGLRGKKNEALRSNPLVCFEMDVEGGLLGGDNPAPQKHSRAFASIIGEGTVEFAKNNDEKRRGFDVIMKHQTGRGDWTYPDAYLAIAEVFWIRVDSFRAARKEMSRDLEQMPEAPRNYDFGELANKRDGMPGGADESHGMD